VRLKDGDELGVEFEGPSERSMELDVVGVEEEELVHLVSEINGRTERVVLVGLLSSRRSALGDDALQRHDLAQLVLHHHHRLLDLPSTSGRRPNRYRGGPERRRRRHFQETRARYRRDTALPHPSTRV